MSVKGWYIKAEGHPEHFIPECRDPKHSEGTVACEEDAFGEYARIEGLHEVFSKVKPTVRYGSGEPEKPAEEKNAKGKINVGKQPEKK